MSERIDFEQLMAYADGELDEAAAAAVEAALAADPGLREELARLRQQGALLRSALNPFLQEAPPPVQAAVLSARTAARRPAWRMPAAIAASLAGTLLAIGAGWLAADYSAEERAAAIEAERRELAAMVSTALEERLSGDSLSWKDPESGLQASVTPLRTFRAQSGQWCREYLRTIADAGEVEEHRAVACREGKGEWRDRLEIVDAS
jgi:surface antigen